MTTETEDRLVYARPVDLRPQYQKIFGGRVGPNGETDGDCWPTAIASIMGLARDDVPHFTVIPGPGANWDALRAWARLHHGLDWAAVPAPGPDHWTGIIDVPSTRLTGKGHAVVVTVHGQDPDRPWEVVWDPRPGDPALSYLGRLLGPEDTRAHDRGDDVVIEVLVEPYDFIPVGSVCPCCGGRP